MRIVDQIATFLRTRDTGARTQYPHLSKLLHDLADDVCHGAIRIDQISKRLEEHAGSLDGYVHAEAEATAARRGAVAFGRFLTSLAAQEIQRRRPVAPAISLDTSPLDAALFIGSGEAEFSEGSLDATSITSPSGVQQREPRISELVSDEIGGPTSEAPGEASQQVQRRRSRPRLDVAQVPFVEVAVPGESLLGEALLLTEATDP